MLTYRLFQARKLGVPCSVLKQKAKRAKKWFRAEKHAKPGEKIPQKIVRTKEEQYEYMKKYRYSEEGLLCPHCGFKTHHINSMKVHLTVKHAALIPERQRVKKKKCKYCDYSAYNPTNLARHVVNVHEFKMGLQDDKALRCPHCPYTTLIKNVMKVHITHVHEKVPYKKRTRTRKNKAKNDEDIRE